MYNAGNMKRREFITGVASAAVGMAGVWMARRVYGAECAAKLARVRLGFLSDSHYANVDYAWDGDDRFFFASLAKMRAAVAKFNELKLDMAVEGGDMTDWSRVGASAKGEKDEALTNAAFDEFEAEFLKFNGPCYHVPGNHDFCSFTPEEFYARVKNAGAPMTEGYYAFTKNGIRLIVLDANYGTGDRHYSKDWPWSWTDSNVSSAQLKWLDGELAAAKGPCVVFCHEILHPNGAKGHVVKNAAAVRTILETSGKVKTVLMGHQHSGLCEELNGILYYAIPAQVTKSRNTNSFAEVDILGDGSASITGYFLAQNRKKQGLCGASN